MEPVTVFMLSNTVVGILVSLGKLLKDAKHNDKMLDGCEQDLVSLKLIIEQAQTVLEDQTTKERISHNGTQNVLVGVEAAFQDCLKFLNDLSDLVTKNKSKRTSFIRAVNGKYRSSDRLGLQRQIQQKKNDVQIGLAILTVQAVLKTSSDSHESSSEIVKRIQALQDHLNDRFPLSSNDDSISPTASGSTAVVGMRLGSPLENAARETINQAVAIWKEQRAPPSGSIHTVETQTTMGASSADPNQPVVIAVCGMTGSGKSSFISAAAGFDVGVGRTLRSETSAVVEFQVRFQDQDIILVDTPGFADTTISDTAVLKMIAEWMERSYKKQALLSGIIYLHQIHHNRVEGPSLRNIELFRKLCGENGLKNVILATTMWDTAKTPVETAIFEDREQQLVQYFWAKMVDHGSQVRRHNNDQESAFKLIGELVQHQAIPLDIQTELVDQHKPLGETAAGEYVDEELQKMRKKHQEELDDLLQMMETSTEAARHEIAQEYEMVLEKMRVTEEQTRQLHAQRIGELSRQRDEEARARSNDVRAYEKKLKGVQASFATDMKGQAKAYDKELKRVRETSAKEQSELAKRHEQNMVRLERNLEANSSKEKAAMAKHFETQFSQQLQASQASADDKIARLTEQLHKMQSIDTDKDDRIENLAHQLRAIQDSNNNNNINSGNSTNRSYHNHLTPASSSGSDGYSGGSIPPPPEPPQLLKVPRPAKHWIARGEAEKTENLRRMREHEKRLDAYYRKYGA